MQTYISILRGINVSGHRIIKMDALKKLLLRLGYTSVHSYIQSGNLIYRSADADLKAISVILKNAIEKEFGFEVPIITLTSGILKEIINNNPFKNDQSKDPGQLYITFLSEKPNSGYIQNLKKSEYPTEEFELTGNAVYLYCPKGYNNTKLNNNLLEKKLNVCATTRNWKTINELSAIAEKISEA